MGKRCARAAMEVAEEEAANGLKVRSSKRYRLMLYKEPIIQLEVCYWGKCIFCSKTTGYRAIRDDGMKHEVYEKCANTSRTIECANERYAIIDESA